MFIRIRSKQYRLWHAVDQNGVVLDILVQSRRNKKAAKRFFRKLLKGLRYAPRIITSVHSVVIPRQPPSPTLTD
ncbi:hypothetical protein [Azospirillum melinis]